MRLPATVLVLVAAALSGCGGGGDKPAKKPPPERRLSYARVAQVPLGTQRAKVEQQLGSASAAATSKYAVDAHDRQSCIFYPLVQTPASIPDAVRLCFDARGRLEASSTVNAGAKAPGEPASSGPRDNSIGKPLKPGDKPPSTTP